MKLVWLVICLAAAPLGLAHAFAPSQAFLQTPPGSAAGRYMRRSISPLRMSASSRSEPLQFWLVVRELGTYRFEASRVVLPLKEVGDIEVLPGHEPVLLTLDDIGVLRVEGKPLGTALGGAKLYNNAGDLYSAVVSNGGAVVGPGYVMAFVEDVSDIQGWDEAKARSNYNDMVKKMGSGEGGPDEDPMLEVKTARTFLRAVAPGVQF
ncbi:unnamed protein product [Vitrella brassicaformis CCMP3155]|uniref:Uncharacterized protein n=1 Tax=Vitrella brassicaformis (strain CCMP3155) TaxID=1169540 RepID=A0A0G4FMN2_VITBC|nr:unnamed protein product [Vitrella brassicaformis CCMP3155]|mmetsp:Transcript_6497/g.15716  ORF Transcript_6497/g.15716 Transcript_6497/m.15716 type:complete len:207 (-) Transcript_6497:108-728(-)|eukprot:CEM15498.1 unnamed protein product [Vitrella brassicaformis CCMP3155]